MWISKEDYDESGPSIVNRKCYSASSSGYIPRSSPSTYVPAPPAPVNANNQCEDVESDEELVEEPIPVEEKKPEEVKPAEVKPPTSFKHDVPTPNVVCVSMSGLGKASEQLMTGDAVYCEGCRAILNEKSIIVNNIWTCEFCEHANNVQLEEGEKPVKKNAEYIIEKPNIQMDNSVLLREISEQNRKNDESMVIFCVDISGSMSTNTPVNGEVNFPQGLQRRMPSRTRINRLQCVQAAVHTHLESMAKDFPNQHPALITFSETVTVYGDGYDAPLRLSDYNVLNNFDTCYQRGQAFPGAKRSAKVCHQKLIDRVDLLDTEGSTALGPALTYAIGMASKRPGSKIMICTDGLANVGFGAIEGTTGAAKGNVAALYKRIANIAKENGTTINVLTIRGDDCALEQLAAVADITAGSVDIVDPLDLSKQISKVMSKPVLGTGVTVNVLGSHGGKSNRLNQFYATSLLNHLHSEIHRLDVKQGSS